MSKQAIQILIADDHDVVRTGLRAVLERRPDWQVVAEARDGKEAISKALQTKPTIAILDYAMPLINGVEATRQITTSLPGTQVLIFTMHESAALIHDLLEAGARGYLLKSDAQRLLITAIETMAGGMPFFTNVVSRILLDTFLSKEADAPRALSPRERGVVQLIAEGHGNKEIAGILNISVHTVEKHRAAAMHKLGLTSVADLTRYAIRNNIAEA